MRGAAKGGVFVFVFLGLGACAPALLPPGPETGAPAIAEKAFLTSDGARLPLHEWPAEGTPRAVVVALHGFNDYGTYVKHAAAYLAARRVHVYAYDQRGFGGAPGWGRWPGWRVFGRDLAHFTRLVRARHPGTPVYLLGSSMGGAVIMTALASDDPPSADGVILAAPAVWGRDTMPFYQRWALWLGVHAFPWLKLTGRGLKIRASDNKEMLLALGRDPKVIKETRIDTIWGLVNLMDAALASASQLRAPALILIGDRDEIIKREPTEQMLASLPGEAAPDRRIARYEAGFHMLLRDLGAKTVWRDIAAWIVDKTRPLPSGADG